MFSASSLTPLRLLNESSETQASRSEPPNAFEPALFYDPPYATPTHDHLAWHLVKYLDPDCGLRAAVEEVSLDDVSLHVDFLIEHRGRRVGLMCGASEVLRDRWHDALLMGHGTVDVLYRVQPDDVHNHLHDVLWLVTRWDPSLFSERGRINLHTLSSATAKEARPRPIDTVMRLRYDTPADTAPLSSETCRVQRISQRHPDGWMPVYEHAIEALGLDAFPHRRWARSA